MRITSLATALTILSFTGVDAFFRLPCADPLVVERADPIVNPGAVAGHVHTIMGGNGFGFTMNYASTQASTCSSCRVKADLSNYWVPTLYHKNANGTFTSVEQNGGGLIYYLQRSDPQDPEFSKGLLAFPKEFRMLAGNPSLRSFTNTLEQRAINYACLGVPGKETNHFPLQNCPGGVRAQVFFPSCWDGVNMDSPDHKSHMAYPSNVDSGKCPASHPKRFISLFYEVTWKTAEFPFDQNTGKQPFVWANGDETGYGYHGDFVNGWDVPTLQRAVTECTADSGNIEDCKVFDLYSNDFSKSCKIASSVDEQIKGNLKALPGCNPSTGEGANAPKAPECGATKTISPPSNPFVDLTASKKFAYLGCGKDNIGGRTLTGARLEQKDMTNEKCVDFCTSKGFSIAGTEYSTECYCGNSIPQDRAPIDGLMGDCFMPCGGKEDQNCGGTGQISLYQKCGSTCENISYGVKTPVNVPAVPAVPVASSAAPASSSKAAVGAAPAASMKAVVGAIPTPKNNVKAPAAPANEESEPIETVSASSAISNAQPATTSQAAVAPGSAPKNTKVVAKCAAEVTVTVAETTITVTKRAAPSAAAPETGVKIPSEQNNIDDESPVAGPADEEEDNAPITGPTPTAIEEPIYPTNNGTAGNGGERYRSKGHGRFHHSRRPTEGYAMQTAGAKKN